MSAEKITDRGKNPDVSQGAPWGPQACGWMGGDGRRRFESFPEYLCARPSIAAVGFDPANRPLPQWINAAAVQRLFTVAKVDRGRKGSSRRFPDCYESRLKLI